MPESFVDEHVHATIYTVTNEGREKQFGYATIVLPKANGSMENEADKNLKPKEYAVNSEMRQLNGKYIILNAIVLVRKVESDGNDDVDVFAKKHADLEFDPNSIYNNYKYTNSSSFLRNYFWWGHVLTTKHVEPSLQDKHVFLQKKKQDSLRNYFL